MAEEQSVAEELRANYGWIVLGIVLGVIGLAIFQWFRTPNPNLKVVIDPSARGHVSHVTCTVDALGNGDVSGFEGMNEVGLTKIGAAFYNQTSTGPSNVTGFDYTYFDASDPDAGEGSGVVGFSDVVLSVAEESRPNTCEIRVVKDFSNSNSGHVRKLGGPVRVGQSTAPEFHNKQKSIEKLAHSVSNAG